MCGIAGVMVHGPAGLEDEAVVRDMLATLKHRGPDGFGCETVDQAVLGHARLAIIDLESGDQPQADESGRFHVVVNGEIYNYRELRADLEARGHRFRTQSDIEVIPHLYAEMGDAFVDRLRGMFAIALYDRKKRRLVLVRDRLGKKPLCYAMLKNGIAFSSEPRALTVAPGVDLEPDPEAIELYLTYQYVPAPWSIYRGIKKVPAATLVSLESDGRLQSRRYWDPLPAPDASITEDAALERLDGVLREASKLRLRSDVPVGSFLSGGIDSGLVVSYLMEETDALEAVTVGFPGTAEDERHLTRLTAEATGVALREELVEIDVAPLVNEVLGFMDEPNGDSSCIPTWIVSKATASSVKVAISGDGGDESFAGYASRYRQNRNINRLRAVVPRFLRRPLVGTAARLAPKGDRLPRVLRWKNILTSLSREVEDAYALDMSIFRPETKGRLYAPGFRDALGNFDASRIIREPFRRAQGADLLSQLLYVDRHTYLGEGVLAKVDRMSMAHSLEVRSPLLDQEVVELAAVLPPALKLRGHVGKHCLRALAARRLPRKVVEAKKSGFSPPLPGWLRGPLKPMLEERVLDRSSFSSELFNQDAVRAMLAEHVEGRRNHARPLWLLLVLESWAATRRPAGATS